MTREELQKHALDLPESDRATLAMELLTSLPAPLIDEDDGVAEAQLRSAELKEDPLIGVPWVEIKRVLGR